jgi:hypothetical protein
MLLHAEQRGLDHFRSFGADAPILGNDLSFQSYYGLFRGQLAQGGHSFTLFILRGDLSLVYYRKNHLCAIGKMNKITFCRKTDEEDVQTLKELVIVSD